MSNRTVEYILSLQDQASLTWRKFEGTISSGVSRLKTAFGGLAGILGSVLTVGALNQMITASNAAEQSVMKVHNALRAQGEDTPEMVKLMLDYAKALQLTTIYSHEQVETVEAMLIALTGYTGEGVKPLVKATLDLAAGMNIDVETAARLLARTEEGAEGLKRMGIIVGDTTSEFDRLNAVYAAIEKRFPNLATALGSTTAGEMIKAKNAAKELEEQLGDMMKKTIQPALTALAPVLAAIIGSVKMAFVGLAMTVVVPLALIEAGLNKLRVTQSHYFQEMAAGGVKLAQTIVGDVDGAFVLWGIDSQKVLDNAKTGMAQLAGVTVTAAFAMKQLPTPPDWKTAVRSVISYDNALKVTLLPTIKDVETNVIDTGEAFDEYWTAGLREVEQASMGVARNFYDYFQGNIQGVTGLFKSFVQTVISEVEGLIATLAAKAVFAQLLSFIFPAIGFAGFFNQMMGGLKIFHAGGVVRKAHAGLYMDAPASQEFPIIVRGGETIRTEGQEASVRAAMAGRDQVRKMSARQGVTGNVTNHYWNIHALDPASFLELISRPDYRRAIAQVGDEYARKGH
jgi:hypothetical protein